MFKQHNFDSVSDAAQRSTRGRTEATDRRDGDQGLVSTSVIILVNP